MMRWWWGGKGGAHNDANHEYAPWRLGARGKDGKSIGPSLFENTLYSAAGSLVLLALDKADREPRLLE